MSKQSASINIAGDLRTLPLPPEELWVRPPRPATPLLAQLVIVALALFAVALIVVPLMSPVSQQPAASGPVATTPPSASVAPTASPSPTATSLTCPPGQMPLFDITFPPPPGSTPGTGSANAEAAFRRLRPNITDFTLTYPFGSRPGAPAWIVAGDETFVAQILGTPDGNNWFAFPARFLGCVP
jgi:hypothetical protein